jgi:hypothetical protein
MTGKFTGPADQADPASPRAPGPRAVGQTPRWVGSARHG